MYSFSKHLHQHNDYVISVQRKRDCVKKQPMRVGRMRNWGEGVNLDIRERGEREGEGQQFSVHLQHIRIGTKEQSIFQASQMSSLYSNNKWSLPAAVG